MLKEDIDIGVNNRTDSLAIQVVMYSESGNYDFTSSIDPSGAVIVTPLDPKTKFIDACLHLGSDITTTSDVTTNFTTQFVITVDCVTISEYEEFNYNIDIDASAQLIITPDKPDVQIVSASVNNSLNLVTENSLMNILTTDCTEAVNTLVTTLEDALKAAESAKEAFTVAKILTTIDIDIIEPLKKIQNSCNELLTTVTDTATSLAESTDNELDRHNLIQRFMRGELPIFEEEVEPNPKWLHLHELDTVYKLHTVEYYYDEEADAIISYYRGNEQS